MESLEILEELEELKTATDHNANMRSSKKVSLDLVVGEKRSRWGKAIDRQTWRLAMHKLYASGPNGEGARERHMADGPEEEAFLQQLQW